MRCPLIVNSDGIWGKSSPPVPVDCWVCPVDVPTVNFSAARSMLTTGVSMAKLMSVAPEFTMPVVHFVVVYGYLDYLVMLELICLGWN